MDNPDFYPDLNSKRGFLSKKYRGSVSCRIDANKDKVYRANDPILIAQLVFPQKQANDRRAAFLAILREIKYSNDGKLLSTTEIPQKYGLSASCVVKVRVKMSRLGIIVKREGFWQTSTVFRRTLGGVAEKIESLLVPAASKDERDRERDYIEMAKGERVI